MQLLLLPNSLSGDNFSELTHVKEIVPTLQGLVAESRKSAIAYLLRFSDREKANSLPIFLLNEHTTEAELKTVFADMVKIGGNWGVISDAGLPCIADPGTKLVSLAHERAIPVKAFSGPCSITLALMLSGLNGQKFSFNGYLPRKEEELVPLIKKLEKLSEVEQTTQIFIEAPYRSDKLLQILLENLKESTRLAVLSDLTLETETVYSFSVKKWKTQKVVIGKRATVFVFAA